jgi:hypothetical protein
LKRIAGRVSTSDIENGRRDATPRVVCALDVRNFGIVTNGGDKKTAD